jgi:hypothetical protein
MAISRVKALSEILFERAFGFDRFKPVDSINSRDLVGSYSIEQDYTSYRPCQHLSNSSKYAHAGWGIECKKSCAFPLPLNKLRGPS